VLLAPISSWDATIDYSLDGTTWTQLVDVPPFAQATGAADYVHNTEIPFDGAMANYVKITAVSNRAGGGLFSQFGLSEVRFLYVPVWPTEPQPASGAVKAVPSAPVKRRSDRLGPTKLDANAPSGSGTRRTGVVEGQVVGRECGVGKGESPANIRGTQTFPAFRERG
jgi:hypothetical protein